MTDPLDLRSIVRDVIATSDDLTPYILAERVAARIPARDTRAAFAQTLPAFIRDVILTDRPTAPRPAEKMTTPSAPPPGGARSPKVAAIRESWRRYLTAVYTSADGTQKRLAAFTRDDVEHLAAVCDDLARANAAKADVWRRLAGVVPPGGTVADVPEDVLAATLP